MSYTDNRFIAKDVAASGQLVNNDMNKRHFAKLVNVNANTTVTLTDETDANIGSVLLVNVGEEVLIEKQPAQSLSTDKAIYSGSPVVGSEDTDSLTLAAGAVERTYSAYVFDTTTPYDDQTSYDAYFTGSESPSATTTVTSISRSATVPENTSYTMIGYFKAPATGTFTFFINSDDASYLFLGGSADNPPVGINLSNAVVDNGGKHGATERSGNFYLEQDNYYKLFAVFGNHTGPGTAVFSFSGPSISKTTDFSGRLFYNSDTNGH